MTKNVYGFSAKQINGSAVKLADYEGKVLLVVNVASKCGLTPQYDALEKIHERYHDQGFEVLGFPANEFGAQEPGTNAEIQEFCRANFGVKFPMFEKVVVKGEGQHPLFNFLTTTLPTATSPQGSAFEEKLKGYGITRTTRTDILWNFEKFLINRKGEVVGRFNPDVTPEDTTITNAIEDALKS